MSVIVAIKDKENDCIYMGSDSLISYNNDHRMSLKSKANTKIFKPEKHNDIVIGPVGELRDLNLLTILDEWVDELTIYKDEVIDKKYVIRNIIPFLREFFEENGRLDKNNGIETIATSFLLAHKNTCFWIDHDFCVIEMEDDVLTVGSGGPISKGASDIVKRLDLTPVEKIKTIIETTIDNVSSVGYPIRILNTLNDEEFIFE